MMRKDFIPVQLYHDAFSARILQTALLKSGQMNLWRDQHKPFENFASPGVEWTLSTLP